MFKLKFKKLLKFGALVGIKEGNLFLGNLYGLYAHPFLTAKRIVINKDFSQEILIFGLPIYLWLGWVFILLVSRIFVFGRLQFGFWAKASFLLSSLFASILSLFLGYWILMVLKKKGEK